MDRKTKHRILGILVVIGLGIIVLPFFQNSSELSSETTLAKAPPFPDQAVQVTGTPTVAEESPSDQPTDATTADNAVSQRPDDTIDPNQSSAANVQAPEIKPMPAPVANDVSPDKINSLTPDAEHEAPPAQIVDRVITPETAQPTPQNSEAQATDTPVKQQPATKSRKHRKATHASKLAALPKPRMVSLNKAPLDANGLVNLKNAVWIIQMGTFKNKSQAIRLVNQLRANGYSAFIQQVTTALGHHTQVFVGPENKQTKARALASRLENDMHIRGMVISYKPFTLL